MFQGSTLYTLTGTPTASWIRVGDFGDTTDYMFLKRVTPRYRSTLPSSATATNYHRATLAQPYSQDSVCPMSRNRFDFRRSAHFHTFRFDFVGPCSLDGLDIDLQPASRE